MDEKEILKERFKSAISSAVKAISENFDLQIKFDTNTDSNKNSINLPEVANLKNFRVQIWRLIFIIRLKMNNYFS